ncbi:hypothetical protein Poli38472_010280 [Pythium oligandrum]|uniref:Protein-serine/threonine kinase n=1 Tax=Pythium oligandrum TaxID=41045 RepID=A0A8K1C978_PYTOL|nr:hypothetical protein Poli38472_010280 [Pythium oligandrum]|eukprot:TMW58721.1 hypothetical protein Poli38472_010280 [Pythium oligandrum]
MRLTRPHYDARRHAYHQMRSMATAAAASVSRQLTRDLGLSMPMKEIRDIAKTPPTPMTLQQMKTFADGSNKTHLIASTFLHKELQIRFAHAITELSELPVGLNETESIRKAMRVYSDAILAIQSQKSPQNEAEDLEFTDMLRKAKQSGANLVPLICGGLKELGEGDQGDHLLHADLVQEDIKQRLDAFFLARIGIRMLIGQHVDALARVGGRVELVNVEDTVRSACDRATKLCKLYCGVAPNVEIHLASNAGAPFTYVESHLHHMVFELVKNAMRATVEFHASLQTKAPGKVNTFRQVMNPNSQLLGFVMPHLENLAGVTVYPDIRIYRPPGELPPVQVVVCQGTEDLTIMVSDEGGGVPRSSWHKLWHYAYTTSPPYPPKDTYGYHSFREHFSGGGYGLPIARLFARYFGGEVTFISLEGSGSSAFIQAHRLGQKTELVPGHETFSLVQPLCR